MWSPRGCRCSASSSATTQGGPQKGPMFWRPAKVQPARRKDHTVRAGHWPPEVRAGKQYSMVSPRKRGGADTQGGYSVAPIVCSFSDAFTRAVDCPICPSLRTVCSSRADGFLPSVCWHTPKPATGGWDMGDAPSGPLHEQLWPSRCKNPPNGVSVLCCSSMKNAVHTSSSTPHSPSPYCVFTVHLLRTKQPA